MFGHVINALLLIIAKERIQNNSHCLAVPIKTMASAFQNEIKRSLFIEFLVAHHMTRFRILFVDLLVCIFGWCLQWRCEVVGCSASRCGGVARGFCRRICVEGTQRKWPRLWYDSCFELALYVFYYRFILGRFRILLHIVHRGSVEWYRALSVRFIRKVSCIETTKARAKDVAVKFWIEANFAAFDWLSCPYKDLKRKNWSRN